MAMERSITVRAEGGPLTAVELAQLVRKAPPEAELIVHMHDKGTQRDPWPVLVGMTARWTEGR